MSIITRFGLTWSVSVAAGCGALLVATAVSAAVPRIPETEGWGGYIATGLAYIDIESRTIAGTGLINLSNPEQSDITSAPAGRNSTYTGLLGELTYTFANRQQFFIGTSVQDAVTLDGGTLGGWRKGTGEIGTFQVALLANLVAPLDVYADPFETGKRRSSTTRSFRGVRLEWDRILRSPFGAQLDVRKLDVDAERSCLGTSDVPNTSCQDLAGGPVDISLLARDASEVWANVYYSFKFGDRHLFRPLVSLGKRDADGDAETFNYGRVQMIYSYVADNWVLVTNGTYGVRNYDTANPIYGIERDSKSYAVDLTVFRSLGWGEKGRWQVFLTGFLGEVDSDIDFYDAKISRVVGGLQYRFGNLPSARRDVSEPAPQVPASL